MVQALRDEYRVTVLSWVPVDVDQINRYFGTSLRSSDFTPLLPGRRVRAALDRLPLNISTLKASFLRRQAKRIAHEFDVIVGAHGEADFGRPGIQYVHYPVRHVPAAPENLRWYHTARGLSLYERGWSLIAPFDDESMRSNVTLVNSRWTGAVVTRVHGIPVQVVYPPAPGVFDAVPWDAREDGFVCVGRLSPEKRVEDVVEIVGRIRRTHPQAHLHIVGADNDSTYAGAIRALARRAGSWVTVEGVLPAPALSALLSRHRYFLHAMREEHFGMSIAQAVRAGCVPFVPDGGGQVEIVGDEPALRYQSIDDASAKIERVMASAELQRALGARLGARAEEFGPERFMARIRAIVTDSLSARHRT